MNKLSGWNDSIVAIATAPGVGAIATIRLSGLNVFSIINDLFPSKDIFGASSHSIHVGYLKDDDEIIDEVVISLFKGPRSYTGEDVIEIGCHGSPFIQQQILNACIRKGARLAAPGEFTQRAFINGKLDLVQAEAVADLIASNTAISQKTALHNMRGGFSSSLKMLRERLIKFSALIELELDFSQEDVEFADRSQFYALIGEIEKEVHNLISSFELGNVIKNGAAVAIIGKPNAGKSTLLNALLNENRALVSDIPGTTRDTIEEIINIDGILFRLIDTAGIRNHTTDAIEKAGIERSWEKMKQADLVLYIFDAAESIAEVESFEKNIAATGVDYFLLCNKIDQAGEAQSQSVFGDFSNIVFIAAKDKTNIETLKKKMVNAVLKGQVQIESSIVTNARHFHALQEVDKSITDIKTGLDNKIAGDLLALDIRRGLHFLGEITGEVNSEDMLDYIFSKFCIGK